MTDYKATIHLPRRLKHVEEIAQSFSVIEKSGAYHSIEFDFSRVEFAEPFAMLYLRARASELMTEFPDSEFILLYDPETISPFQGYASHVGFFQSMGFDLGQPVGYARGSRRYFPIERWDISALGSEAAGEPLGKIVDEKSSKLAEILTQRNDGDAYKLLQFSIREIARNAVEHSRGRSVHILSQYWPRRNEAEIVVLDNGIGIAENLYDLEYINVANNMAGIKVALLPGISGVPRSERAAQDSDWRNSGFGLYVVSRYCGKFGSFDIISNGDYLRLSGNRQTEKKVPLRGTAVCAHLRLGEIVELEKFHEQIIREGEQTRSEILKDFEIDASAASKHLQRHFNIKLS